LTTTCPRAHAELGRGGGLLADDAGRAGRQTSCQYLTNVYGDIGLLRILPLLVFAQSCDHDIGGAGQVDEEGVSVTSAFEKLRENTARRGTLSVWTPPAH